MTWLFAGATLYAAGLALLMVLLPRWRGTRRVMATPLSLVPVGVAYAVLLAWSWQPDTLALVLPGSWEQGLVGGWNPQFLPSLSGIVTLFSRVPTAASLWVHLLAVDLFAARHMYLEGLQTGIPTWHSILLCMTVAPLGLLSHGITKAGWRFVLCVCACVCIWPGVWRRMMTVVGFYLICRWLVGGCTQTRDEMRCMSHYRCMAWQFYHDYGFQSAERLSEGRRGRLAGLPHILKWCGRMA
jgi:hypothetical protein